MTQTVTLEKPEDGRSWRVILVGGEPWGFVQQSHRGMHGVEYYFQDSNLAEVPKKFGEEVKIWGYGGMSGHDGVWSDKRYLRDLGVYGSSSYAVSKAKHEGKYVPLEDRLVAAIKKAIKDRRLLSPSELKAEAEALRTRNAERTAEHERQMRDAFDAKAAKAVESLPEKYRAQMIEPILEAMKWAQTQ